LRTEFAAVVAAGIVTAVSCAGGQRIRLRVTITDQARNRAAKIVTIRLK
jgi:hypothetical protein